jgi:glycosyltransferase involved in cell wall biosynthesis
VAQLEADIPLVAVGFLRWKYASDVALIEELGVRDRVLQTGFVPDEDLPAIYNLASVLVLPSLYEGFGIPILEAMASGCPVVTSRTGCGPEVAGGAAVLVDPYRPEDIAAGIRRVLADPAFAADLVARGREQAARFSWRKAARESMRVYELAAARSRAGAAG